MQLRKGECQTPSQASGPALDGVEEEMGVQSGHSDLETSKWKCWQGLLGMSPKFSEDVSEDHHQRMSVEPVSTDSVNRKV